MPKRPARQRAVLQYPSHWFEPEDFLAFIELRPFSRLWDALGLDDEDLKLLQVMIMTDPKGSPVIEGSGGVRKLRFSPPKWPRGKSGGLRVCYTYVEEVGTVILALVYGKGEKDDLSASELEVLHAVVERSRQSLMSKPYRCQRKAD